MAESSIIKEFLVALGFKVDEEQFKKFDEGLGRATKGVVALGAAVLTLGTTMAYGVEKFANNLERLYFASKRTGESATQLRAFTRAAQDFGVSQDEAMSSVESFSRYIRNNPGAAGFLGVTTHFDANGNLTNGFEALMQFGKRLASMPTYLANQYASQAGISDNLMLAFRDPSFAQNVKSVYDRLNNAGFDKAARDAHEFMVQLRETGDYLVVLGTQVYEAITKQLGGGLKELNAWMRAHGKEITQEIVDGFNKLIAIGAEVKTFLTWLLDKFIELDKATDGWSTKILGVVIAFRVLFGMNLLGLFGSLTAEIVRFGLALAGVEAVATRGSIGAMVGQLARAAGLMRILTPVGAVAGGFGLGWLLDKYFPNNVLARGGAGLGAQLFHAYGGEQEKDTINYLDQSGLPHSSVLGIAAALARESGFDAHRQQLGGPAYGLEQLEPARQAEFQRLMGKDIHESNLQEQVQFLIREMHEGRDSGARSAWSLLKSGTDNPWDASEIFTRLVLRPANVEDAVAKDRRYVENHYSSQATFHVDGSKSPKETADTIESRLQAQWSDLTRNGAPVAQ